MADLGPKPDPSKAFDSYSKNSDGKIKVQNNTAGNIYVRVSLTNAPTQDFVTVPPGVYWEFQREKYEIIWVSYLNGGPVTTYFGFPQTTLNVNNAA
jgi:hypothetical protein